ncbi:helix-turn-helix domain-containing protein [Cellulomonas gilvus]|uniref:Transcriptional regulator, AraC family n=1 Tax=Cellulomonas gilvus (strain ATCC 13127 / NRRL B-14078) TaxID=593907 RepID=F8A3Z8_CELGA|nr:helix-turn-helix domain-containing protein [Cellulomonas gilvus]AEI13190.1 transcriptional regulator, AraC family [Cellulomonas gilvus ATCC 13127]
MRSRGHLNPGDAEVTWERHDPGLPDLVRHVWVARWDVPAGQSRTQRVLTYPACNVVVTPEAAVLVGPSTVVTTQELTGRSWVVGVLLWPAAAALLTATRPGDLVGRAEPLVSAPHSGVSDAMAAHADVLPVLRTWLAPVAARVDDAGRLVNEACRLAEERADVTRVGELAALLHTSTRSLSRLVSARTGLTPKWLIDCRRLQHAALRLFTEPGTDLATLAAELGYADQAHLTRAYRAVLGETPAATRRAGRAATDRPRPPSSAPSP